MLNWIAIWTASWLFGDGGPLQNSHQARRTRSPTRSRTSAELPVFWGAQGFQGLDIGFFIALGALVVFWVADQPHDARLRGARRRLQPGRGRVRRHQREEEPHPRDGDLGCLRRSRRGGRHARRPTTSTASSTSRSARSGFIGIAVALLGRNTAVGDSPRGAPLRRPHLRDDPGSRLSNVIQPELASNLTLHHPGAHRALHRRRHPHPLRLELAQEAAAERPAQAPAEAAA